LIEPLKIGKNGYTNTSVLINNLRTTEIIEKIKIYKWVGYQNLFLSIDYNLRQMGRDLLENLRIKMPTINVYGKLLLHPKNMNDLKSKLKNIYRYKEFAIAVSTFDTELMTFSANDTRVDIISASDINVLKAITPGIISLVKQHAGNKFIEFSLTVALKEDNYNRSKIFRELNHFLKIALKNENILLYAGSEEGLNLIRGPKEIIFSLNTLFDIPLIKCKKILRENSSLLIDKINRRSDDSIIEFGAKKVATLRKVNFEENTK